MRAGPQSGPVLLEAGDLVTFAADVPHVYEAVEDTHCVLLMAYP
jgi:quercetin dioxygenase-like cupin family protein